MLPNYPQGSRSYGRRVYQCLAGHERKLSKVRPGPVVCEKCSTPDQLVYMEPVRNPS